MEFRSDISLRFSGNDAEQGNIEFYDLTKALMGFQRSLAITTHLVLTGEVIVQAPSLKAAKIFVHPPEEGSWEITASILVGAFTVGPLFASRDSVMGHLTHSAYDYVISKSLGFRPDFDKTLGQQYEEIQSQGIDAPILSSERFDSAIEKCDAAVLGMHRPIVQSQSATKAQIIHSYKDSEVELKNPLSQSTYDYMTEEIEQKNTIIVTGRVSSYNLNTLIGRLFVPELKRPISFEVSRKINNRLPLAKSLLQNAQNMGDSSGNLKLKVYPVETRTGVLKKYIIFEIIEND